MFFRNCQRKTAYPCHNNKAPLSFLKARYKF
uniref:Uncharacterized protein n=1 Tax=Arundo donax TaxID=35708 RepID=A0A0A9A6R5_ARUDO